MWKKELFVFESAKAIIKRTLPTVPVVWYTAFGFQLTTVRPVIATELLRADWGCPPAAWGIDGFWSYAVQEQALALLAAQVQQLMVALTQLMVPGPLPSFCWALVLHRRWEPQNITLEILRAATPSWWSAPFCSHCRPTHSPRKKPRWHLPETPSLQLQLFQAKFPILVDPHTPSLCDSGADDEIAR